jgi:hypothetical protein
MVSTHHTVVNYPKIHGNHTSSQRPTDLYRLVNLTTAETDKIGVTSYPSSRYSPAYLKAENVRYETLYHFLTRRPALVAESILLTTYRAEHGTLPRLNRTTR